MTFGEGSLSVIGLFWHSFPPRSTRSQPDFTSHKMSHAECTAAIHRQHACSRRSKTKFTTVPSYLRTTIARIAIVSIVHVVPLSADSPPHDPRARTAAPGMYTTTSIRTCASWLRPPTTAGAARDDAALLPAEARVDRGAAHPLLERWRRLQY